MTGGMPHVPISWGELIDKITILQIKTERLAADTARANAAKELALLSAIAAPVLAGTALGLAERLKAVNESLWDIEDRIRDRERTGAFDAEFVALARSVYRTNDARGALKRELNLLLDSELIEEKSYTPY